MTKSLSEKSHRPKILCTVLIKELKAKKEDLEDQLAERFQQWKALPDCHLKARDLIEKIENVNRKINIIISKGSKKGAMESRMESELALNNKRKNEKKKKQKRNKRSMNKTVKNVSACLC